MKHRTNARWREGGHNNFLIMFCLHCHDETVKYIKFPNGEKWLPSRHHWHWPHFQFNRILFPSHLSVQVRPQESEVVHLLAVKCEMGVMELYFEAHSHCPGISVDRRWHPWELHCHSAGKVETFKWRIVFVELIFDTGQGGVWSLGQARLLRARG